MARSLSHSLFMAALLVVVGSGVAAVPAMLSHLPFRENLFAPVALDVDVETNCRRRTLADEAYDPAYRQLEKGRSPADAETPSSAKTGAVILAYHRFGENKIPSTNIRIEQIEAHLEELKAGGFRVLSLNEIVRILRSGETLPDLAIGLSADDSHASIFLEGWPRIRKAGFPLTVFVNTDIIGRGRGAFTWDQLRVLARDGVEIGCHTAAHPHMPEADERQNTRDLVRCMVALHENLAVTPRLFAYPYGEYSAEVRKLIESFGPELVKRHAPEAFTRVGEAVVTSWKFDAAFAQTSSVIHAESDPYTLPRFSMNEAHGRLERFKQVVRLLPLPVKGFAPADSVLPRSNSGRAILPTSLTLELADDGPKPESVSCFVWGEPARSIKIEGRTLKIEDVPPFATRRGRVNCTAPAGQGRFHWFGTQYVDLGHPEDE